MGLHENNSLFLNASLQVMLQNAASICNVQPACKAEDVLCKFNGGNLTSYALLTNIMRVTRLLANLTALDSTQVSSVTSLL